MNYALLDRSIEIRKEHVLAALEVWRYCEDSVRHIFGDRLGDLTADRILSALRESQDGLTRTEISAMFQRNKNHGEIERALSVLRDSKLADARLESTEGGPGRSAERWFATGHVRAAKAL
jgi:hypothetical protein